MTGIVAIVGRPNVGKSTLFNRLIEERQAIVDDMSGVTRDRNYGQAQWNGRAFNVIDTGGYVPNSDDIFEKAIREQVHIAMEEADVLIFMVDVQTGVTPLDRSFANMVRQQPHKVILAANKVDSTNQRDDVYEFYELGLGDLFGISAITGGGTGDLLDAVVEALPDDVQENDKDDIPKFAIVGRPNVGKSSMVNALVGKNINIVTPIAGTTRDSIDTRFKAFGNDILLIDTAGLRKRSKVQENIEFYSTLRTVRAVENSHVVILLIDATLGIEAQDMFIFGMAQKNKKGIVMVVNKWDLVEKDTHTSIEFEKVIRKKTAPFNDIPIVFTSAITKQRLLKTLEIAQGVYENLQRKISTSVLNEVMLKAIERHHPPTHRGMIVRIKYVTQVPGKNPTFLFFTNHPQHIKESYKRYLENKLREHFDFSGVPLNLFFRKK
ncbi:MAG: ribosome biogenesis GTPase Der [Bacteroidia bacterium]|nr:ribosome biogenesis GTPase Der [Bacteroidia bacterium]